MLFYIKVRTLLILSGVLDSVQSLALMTSYSIRNKLSNIVQAKLQAEGRI